MFFTRDYDELYRQIYEDLTENTPITNFGGSSTARAITEAIARRLSQLNGSMGAYINSAYISTATGGALDNIGELYGVTRHNSTRAYSGESSFRFYIDPATGYTVSDLINITNDNGGGISSIVINQGTTITTSSTDISYTTTTPATLTDTGVYVPIIATGSGSEYNVGPGGLSNHNVSSNQASLYAVSRFILCTNDEAIDTGVEYESDVSYRSRIYGGRFAAANANEIAVRNAALSVPGVSDVIISKYPEGIGTYNVTVITEYPIASTAVLNAVSEAVSQVAALGIRPIISTPEYRAIELKVKLHFQPTAGVEMQDSIKGQVRVAIIDYTNNIEIGGSWIVNEVIQRIMEVSESIKDVEQQWFRSFRYQGSMEVMDSGRGMVPSSVDQMQLQEGVNMVWTNQRVNSVNPPEKFLMLGRHLTVC